MVLVETLRSIPHPARHDNANCSLYVDLLADLLATLAINRRVAFRHTSCVRKQCASLPVCQRARMSGDVCASVIVVANCGNIDVTGWEVSNWPARGRWREAGREVGGEMVIEAGPDVAPEVDLALLGEPARVTLEVPRWSARIFLLEGDAPARYDRRRSFRTKGGE